jgi:hypothetical protein
MPKVKMVARTISVRASFCVVAVAVALLHVAAAQDVAERDSISFGECRSCLSNLCDTGQTLRYLKEAVLDAITMIKRSENQSVVGSFLEEKVNVTVACSTWIPSRLAEDAQFIIQCCGTCRRWNAEGNWCSQR